MSYQYTWTETSQTFNESLNIGKGSFGTVFPLNKTTVVKFYRLEEYINNTGTSRDQALKDLKIEFDKQSKIIHPYIAQVQKWQEMPMPAQTIESCESSLSQFIRRGLLNQGPDTRRLKYRILCQIASALAFMHQEEHVTDAMMHRDLKPDNILMRDGVVKLSDFGGAKMLKDMKNTVEATASFIKQIKGTPWYATWDVLEGSYTCKVDVSAFGITAFEVFTGVMLFPVKEFPHGVFESDVQKRFSQQMARPELADKMDEPTKRVIYRCLAYQPKSRPKIVDVMRDLAEIGGLTIMKTVAQMRDDKRDADGNVIKGQMRERLAYVIVE